MDNAVELMIKIYFSLPERETGIKISKHEYDEISIRFPNLLDTLDE